MELVILDKELNRIGEVDNYNSVLWLPKYNDIGECTIQIDCDDENLSLLQEDYYIYRYDDNMICQIDEITLTTDIEQGDYLTIKAYDVSKNILSNRIVWDQIVFNGLAAEFIKKVITDNIINGNQRSRNLTNLIFDDSNFAEFSETISISEVASDIKQLIISICKNYEYGFRITFDLDTKIFIFQLYKGVDRSKIEGETYVEFSPEYSNILTSEYTYNKTNYKNVAVVGAKDSDESLMYVIVYRGDKEPEGLERKELFVDASSTSRDITESELFEMFENVHVNESTYYVYIGEIEIAVATKNGDKLTVTDFTYQKMLEIIGYNALADNNVEQSFTGDIDVIDTYVYKEDYHLGDIVKVINEYGIGASARIIEILETDEGGYSVEPKFEFKEVE